MERVGSQRRKKKKSQHSERRTPKMQCARLNYLTAAVKRMDSPATS